MMKKKTNRKLVLRSYDIRSLFFSSKYIIMILLIPFFKTSGFEAIPLLADYCNILLVLEAITFLFIATITKKISKFAKFIFVFEIWSYIIAPILDGHKPPSIFYLAGAIGIICFLEVGFSYNSKKMLDGLSSLFTIMIFLNCILAFIFPKGIVSGGDGIVYLFGSRTGFSLFIIPGLLICLLYDNFLYRTTFSMRTIVCFICGVTSLLIQWVATGIVQVAIVLILYVIALFNKSEKILNVRINFSIIMIATYIITFIGTKSNLFYQLIMILGRDITLTGRTLIWNSIINRLEMNPYYGFGRDSTVFIANMQKQAHNQWLHIAMESGYIGLIIIILAIIISINYLSKYRSTKIYTIMTIFITTILIGCITEIQTYVSFIFMVFEIPFLIQYFYDIDNNTLPYRIIKIRR